MSKKTSKPKAPKAKKVAEIVVTAPAPRDHKNGIPKPGVGTKCADIWTHLDALKAAGKEITFEEMRATIDSSTADATLRTQRQRWVKFNGLKKEAK
jgi:hypothetical protein